LDARVPIFKMFHPSSKTARTHAHTSIITLKSLVNFCWIDLTAIYYRDIKFIYRFRRRPKIYMYVITYRVSLQYVDI